MLPVCNLAIWFDTVCSAAIWPGLICRNALMNWSTLLASALPFAKKGFKPFNRFCRLVGVEALQSICCKALAKDCTSAGTRLGNLGTMVSKNCFSCLENINISLEPSGQVMLWLKFPVMLPLVVCNSTDCEKACCGEKLGWLAKRCKLSFAP